MTQLPPPKKVFFGRSRALKAKDLEYVSGRKEFLTRFDIFQVRRHRIVAGCPKSLIHPKFKPSDLHLLLQSSIFFHPDCHFKIIKLVEKVPTVT